MSTTAIKFYKGAYGIETAKKNATGGAVVFDTTSHCIFVNGEVYGGGTITDAQLSGQTLTIYKDGTNQNIVIDFTQFANATSTQTALNAIAAELNHFENAIGDCDDSDGEWGGYGTGNHYLDGIETLTAGDKALDAAIYAVDQKVNNINGAVQAIEFNNVAVGEDSNHIVNIATDGTYNATNNKIATESTVSGAIDGLDVTGYAQGSIAASSGENPTTSEIKIKGIKEENGKIANDSSNDTTINVDGVYNASTNMIATKSTVTNAINALDVSDISGFGADKTLATLTETDGKIAATFQDIEIDGNKVTSLNNYNSSSVTGNVSSSDNLVTALEKIEAKADSAISAAGVTKFGGKTGAITLGNGLQMNSTSDHEVEVKTTGYITSDSNGVDIDSSKVKTSSTHTANTDLMTEGAVTDVIEGLDVTAFAQASMTNGTGTSTLTINGIGETDGKIATDSSTNKLDVAINGVYNETTNKIATESTVSGAIDGLDANTVATATTATAASGTGTTVTIKGVKEDAGVISQGEGTTTFTIGDGALKLSGYGATDTTSTPTIPTVAATDVFSANDTADSTIALGNEFVLDATNKTIGIRTKTAVSATNAIATEADIASLSGAMHYMGGVTAYPTPTAATKAGDTYVVTTAFEYPANSGNNYEVGDMLVADADGANANYTVVQSNLTLGVGAGQVAANDTALTSGKIVAATGTGIQTTAYSVTDIASHAVTVSASNDVVTVTDTMTVGGTAQQGQSFTVEGGNKLTASASGNAITISHDTVTAPTAPTATSRSQGDTVTVMTGITEDDYGHVTSYTTDSFTIPTVNDATLTLAGASSGPISVSGSKTGNAATFTANDSEANTITITHAAAPTTGTPAAIKVAVDSYGHVKAGSAIESDEIALDTSNALYNASDCTTVDAALTKLNNSITNANITIDGHKGAIETGIGLTDVDTEGGSFDVKIDSTNARGLSVSADGIAMDAATGSTFGTVQVTTGNGLSLSNGVVSYAHNTSAITVASKDSSDIITINGTLTPDASDAITTGNAITLAKVAATGSASDVTVTSAAYGGSTATTDLQQALTNLAASVAVSDGSETVVVNDTKATTIATVGGNNIQTKVAFYWAEYN